MDHIFDSSIGYWLDGKKPTGVLRLCSDTRSLCPGDCYVALITSARDGHIFLKDARDNGAPCAIVSRPVPGIDLPQFVCTDTNVAIVEMAKLARSMFRGTTIAITGSFGKTTTKDILKLLLGIERNVTFGNRNGQLGVPMTLASITNDEAFAVIEVGIDTIGAIDRLVKLIMPNISILTGIGKIHMLGLGSESVIAHEKSKLLLEAIRNNGHGIFPEECLKFDNYQKIQEYCRVAKEDGEDVGYHIDIEKDQYHVTVRFKGRVLRFIAPHLMSLGIVKDFVLACICALECGIGSANIQSRISLWQPSKWRGEIIKTSTKTYFADCYNANVVAFIDSLFQFDRLFPHGDRLFVIGALRYDEVGSDVTEDNARIFKNLPLRKNDRVIIIGEAMDFSTANMDRQWNTFSLTLEAREEVANFHGVVYLKGHRHYRLENLMC
ncbi:MAG: hypothetical protein LBB16_02500 [Puniceicoccales bacterium]|jgi:UDP-N-acetylmuramoyl-tripeptide--D-alanyl-D-alanine ligase|nr:hypothetical protein [Puniceicoccales bacterium]